jgi:ferrous iron transport protein A
VRSHESKPSSFDATGPVGPEVVTLSALRPGERSVIVQIVGGRRLLGRMTALGFTPGAEVTVIQNFGRGPLIAQVRGARIALGRGEAGKVYIRRRCE